MTTCHPEIPDRERGPVGPTGPRLGTWERAVLGESNVARAMNIWLNLRGSSCDFDDCTVAVAEALGMRRDPAWNICDLLDAACETMNSVPWATVRTIAVDVFFDLRGGTDRVFEHGYHDPRTWSEAVDDAQFDDGGCRVCALDGDGDAEEHRWLAEIAASGRKTWPEIIAAVRAASAAA